ncbi:DDE_3 domain-containing protein [Trichonephila clavipes]|nr:DDE_3 domain-containing protein [Trichonephila clavipes]
MSQQRDLPESMAWRVIGRLESGQTQRSVADAVGVARSVVARLWNRFQETGNVRRRPGAAIGDSFVFQDDNARPHRARLVENMLEAETIQRMEWPACSPDRNQPSMFGTYSDDALLRDQGHLLLSETWRLHFLRSGTVFPKV